MRLLGWLRHLWDRFRMDGACEHQPAGDCPECEFDRRQW